MKLRPRDWAGAAVALLVAATCVRLGFWQLDRLHQRRARNAAVAARRALPAIELRGRGVSGDSARERRIAARGVYDYDHERLWRGRTYEGVPGVSLITPLLLRDGSGVLVDRGWVPSPDAAHVDLGAWREADTVEVLGLGQVAPRGRGDVDPAKLGDSLAYPLPGFIIQQVPPSSALDRPRPPYRWPAAALDDGPHLSYAIQWCSFAVIIVVGTAALVRKTLMAER